MKNFKHSKNKINARPIVRVSYALSSVFFLIGSMLLIAISILRPATFEGMRISVMDLAAPVMQAINTPAQAASDFVKNASGLATLQQQNADLRAENAKLKAWYLQAQNLQSKNEQLQKLANLAPAAGGQQKEFMTAEILSDTRSPFVKSIMIKSGQDQGIAKGDAVTSDQGVVGRILNAGNQSARVLLLTDMNSRIPVEITQGGKVVQAILAGQNDKTPILMHLPAGATVQNGAHVTTSGLGGIFPKGLAVGKIKQAASREAQVQPYMNISETAYLRVIKTPSHTAAWE